MARKTTARLRILSYGSAPFADREEAGKLFATGLSERAGLKIGHIQAG